MEEVDKFYKRQAKELVNMLFDKRFLNDNLSRESIDWLEDYLGYINQSQCDRTATFAVLLAQFRDKKTDTKPEQKEDV